MNLLDQIIDSGTMNTPPPLTSVLRQCILLSSQLKVPVLRTWAERELNGYETVENLPDYRIIAAGAFGAFDGYRQYPSRPIPASMLEPSHRSRAREVYLLDSVAEYEGMEGDGGTLRFYWPGDMIGFYQSKLLQDSVLIHAWQDISKSSVVGMLDTIIVSSLTAIAKRFRRNSAARPPVRWPTRSSTSSTRLVRRALGATTSPSRSRKMACSHSRLRHRHRLNRNCSATRLP
jgi:AbiTii-like protein